MRHAIVIGAGPGGLCAALALRQSGFAPIVCEAASELREIGSGVSLWPNALRALELLGAANLIRARAEPFRAIAMKRPDGRVLFSVPCSGAGGIGWAAALHRTELQSVLVDAVGSLTIRVGYRCTEISSGEREVTASFANGETVTAELLVGADGLRSRVREFVAGRDSLRRAAYRVWRGVANLAVGDGVASTSVGRGAQFGIFPMRDRRTYWFASLTDGASEMPADCRAHLSSQFAGWHAPVETLIAATDAATIVCTDIFDRRPLPRWSRGRVTLLGDAAHPAVPTLGQGACQAIEDASTLAHCLRGTTDVFAAFAEYERRRVGRANGIVSESWWIGQVGQWRHPAACAVRDWLIRKTPQSIHRKQLQQMFNYQP